MAQDKVKRGSTKQLIMGEDLKKLQRIEVEMLVELDRICRKNHITYSVSDGSLLGAIRHKGFIPWDDDADVSMMRSEYNKFREACKKDLDTSRFFLQDWTTDPNYRWGYAKMRRNDTLLIGDGHQNIKQHQGVFMDIFIFDGVPDNDFMRNYVHKFITFCIRKIQYSEIGKTNAKNPLLRKWYKLINKIPVKYTFVWLEKLAKLNNRRQTKYVKHVTYPHESGSPNGIPRSFFHNLMNTDFDGHRVMAFKNYDEYLTMLYGDYMTPLPEKDRVYYEVSEYKFIDVDI